MRIAFFPRPAGIGLVAAMAPTLREVTACRADDTVPVSAPDVARLAQLMDPVRREAAPATGDAAHGASAAGNAPARGRQTVHSVRISWIAALAIEAVFLVLGGCAMRSGLSDRCADAMSDAVHGGASSYRVAPECGFDRGVLAQFRWTQGPFA